MISSIVNKKHISSTVSEIFQYRQTSYYFSISDKIIRSQSDFRTFILSLFNINFFLLYIFLIESYSFLKEVQRKRHYCYYLMFPFFGSSTNAGVTNVGLSILLS